MVCGVFFGRFAIIVLTALKMMNEFVQKYGNVLWVFLSPGADQRDSSGVRVIKPTRHAPDNLCHLAWFCQFLSIHKYDGVRHACNRKGSCGIDPMMYSASP
jgi:hypothetical protein